MTIKNKSYSEFDPGKEDSHDIKGYTFRDFINGQYLNKASVTKHWSYFMFLVFLALIYINNHYSIEKLLREHMIVSSELQELKYEAITTSSELTRMSRQSEVARRVSQAGLGLEVLRTPPRRLEID